MNREVTLKHVDGRVVSYPSITAFAKKHHIGKTHISQIMNDGDFDHINIKNHRIFHKQWYDPTPLNKTICFWDDDDNVFEITNIGDWLTISGMNTASFFRLLNGKIGRYSGFSLPNTSKPVWKRKWPLFEYTLQTPTGKIIKTTSLGKVARMSHLNRRGFYYLGSRFSQYRGWRLLEVKELVNYWNE
jgi:hypothetical protein